MKDFEEALGAEVAIPLVTGLPVGSVSDLLAKRAWFDRRQALLRQIGDALDGPMHDYDKDGLVIAWLPEEGTTPEA